MLRKEFYLERNKEKRGKFFRKYSKEERDQLQAEFYEFLNKIK